MDIQAQVHSPAKLHVSELVPSTPPKAHCSIETQSSPHQHQGLSGNANVSQERTPNGRKHAKQPFQKADKFIEKNSVKDKKKCIKQPFSPIKTDYICKEALRNGHYLVLSEKKKKPKECPECYENIDALELVRVDMKRNIVSIQCPECGLYIYQQSSSRQYGEGDKEANKVLPKGFKPIPVKLGKRE